MALSFKCRINQGILHTPCSGTTDNDFDAHNDPCTCICHSNKEKFYLLLCIPCTETSRPLPQPFSSAKERGEWASGHTAGTGHAEWRVWEEEK